MNYLDCNTDASKYHIIEEHDMEILDNIELIDNIIEGEVNTNDLCELSELNELNEVEFIESLDLEGYNKQEMQQKREINIKSVGEIINENSFKNGDTISNITVELREVELSINTSTVEEVIFKKHRVEIINKQSRVRIMEGVVTGYTLVGRVYDPDIVLEFEDGRTFYNENFGYNMRFYI
jgi:hypothetical protein